MTLIIFGIWLLSVCILAYHMRRAPMGWQDEHGFHEGEEP